MLSSYNVNRNSENDVKSQTMKFSDQSPGWNYHVDSQPDETFNLAGYADADLGEFLSRPVRIAEFEWQVGTNFFHKFNPWDLFYKDPRVQEKIRNFNLLRSKLCLKIILNGNGFYYGRALLSYIPFLPEDEVTVDRTFFLQDLIQASQRPHLYLDPTTSEGGTMCLPFVWDKNWINVPSDEYADLGTCIIHDFGTLEHANGATQSLNVAIFAWAEDVRLAVPTSLDAQAGTMDEYGSGIISKPMSALAAISSRLSDMPVIGAYAKATQMIASGVGMLSKIFGYARPAVLEPPLYYKPHYGGNVANSDQQETVNRLTLDSKQELTVDPRTFGLGSTDELGIKDLAQRESYFTQFTWSSANPSDTLLWNTRVEPTLYDVIPAAAIEYHLTPAAWISQLFQWWSGTIKLRFQIVASAYHRGRLRIVYDPNQYDDNGFNTVYTRIIDLAETRDFEMPISWGQEVAFKETRPIATSGDPDGPIWGTTKLTTDNTYSNGVLSVFVLNDLALPSASGASIQVNVFVSCGDDIEFAIPNGIHTKELSYFIPQAGVLDTQAGQVTDGHTTNDDANAPEHAISTEGVGEERSENDDHTFDVYFGEKFVSLRQLLKRYYFHSAFRFPDGVQAALNDWTVRLPDMPEYYGWDPNGKSTAVGTGGNAPFNFTVPTLLNYITPCFVVRKGSIRYKYVLSQSNLAGELSGYTVARLDNLGAAFDTIVAMKDNVNNVGQFARNASSVAVKQTHQGAYLSSLALQNIAEIELPFYSNRRFAPARKLNFLNGNTSRHRVSMMVDTLRGWNDSTSAAWVDRYVSIGEDFTLNFFVGVPRMYAVPTPVAVS